MDGIHPWQVVPETLVSSGVNDLQVPGLRKVVDAHGTQAPLVPPPHGQRPGKCGSHQPFPR